jgi:WD40 repeat protein
MKIKAGKKNIFTGHHGGIYGLAYGSTPDIIYSGSSDKFVGAWNIVSGKQEEFAIEFPSPVYSLLFLKERNILLAGTGAGTFHVIDVLSKNITSTAQLHTAQIFDLAYSPKHSLIFSASGDGYFSTLDSKTFEKISSVKICGEKVRSVSINSNEDLLAVTGGNGTIHIFSLPEMTEIISIPAHTLSANSTCWHPGGKYLLSGGRDAHLKIWDAKNNFELITDIPAHNFAIYHIAFSPDEKLFATASRDKSMKIWDAEDFKLLLRCGKDGQDGHKNSVNRLLWNENGLVSGADDRSMIVWDVEENEL